MRTKTFAVPADSMPEFAGIIEEHELENSITGVNDDDEILVQVSYEKDERSGVFELMELLDMPSAIWTKPRHCPNKPLRYLRSVTSTRR